jgi:hypothetical protein
MKVIVWSFAADGKVAADGGLVPRRTGNPQGVSS